MESDEPNVKLNGTISLISQNTSRKESRVTKAIVIGRNILVEFDH